MKSKRSQAAMEFLMTYGWAILAAVIVIAVLAYFGVFSPSTYVPNSCTLAAPFGCNAGIAETDGVTVELINGAGETLTVTNVAVAGCGSTAGTGAIAAGTPTPVVVACTLTEGSKFKGDITVTYNKAGSTLSLTTTGSITSKVTLAA
jgi:hypothetical protein